MLTPREAFKVGFLARCVEGGLTLDETHGRVKSALDKLASPKVVAAGAAGAAGGGTVTTAGGGLLAGAGRGALNVGSWLLAKAMLLGGAGLVLAPPAVGSLAGYAAAHLTDLDDTDVQEIKKRELLDEYRRQTALLLREREAREYQRKRRRTGRIFL